MAARWIASQSMAKVRCCPDAVEARMTRRPPKFKGAPANEGGRVRIPGAFERGATRPGDAPAGCSWMFTTGCRGRALEKQGETRRDDDEIGESGVSVALHPGVGGSLGAGQ